MSAEREVLATKDAAGALEGTRRLVSDQSVQVGPLSHLVEERDTLLKMQWEHFDVEMLGTTVGAVLNGLDLSKELPGKATDEVQRALDAYKVVFFRDQHLSPDQHLSFARRFGALEVHPFIPSNDKRPELVRFTKDADTGGYENIWHHDVTWRECPSRSTILRAVEVPPVGGDTLFADMCAAYDGLPDDLRA
ncbi:MAG: TauD/TfdA family dioxygenase, partial [Acidimicrobiales bacterium]|nr:TauD/TfdA family dioxygenase [Acidimicrobiales bacterium]